MPKTTKPKNLSEVGDKGFQEEGGTKNIGSVFQCFHSQSSTYYGRVVSGLTIFKERIKRKDNKLGLSCAKLRPAWASYQLTFVLLALTEAPYYAYCC